MPNVKNNAAAQETCRRLIDAAGEVFAQRGLHAATIKEITDRAGVNMAAVNYHFSDKFELYAAVVRHALTITPLPSVEKDAGSPEDRLRAHVRRLFSDFYISSRPAWWVTLLAHEFAQPTEALNAVMEELIRPRADALNSIVRDILGPAASDEQVLRAAVSVAAQYFLYLYQGQVVRRLHPHLLREDSRDELVNHIVEFSLSALHAMRRRLRSSSAPRKRGASKRNRRGV